MNTNGYVLELMSSFICGKKPDFDVITDEEFFLIRNKADNQKIFSMCADVMLKYHLLKNDVLIDYCKKRLLSDIKYFYEKFDNFKEIYTSLTENGINSVLLKGFLCNDYYPVKEYRISGDEDLLIRVSDSEKCKRIFKKNGFVYDNHNRSHEIEFYNLESGLKIEIHTGLFDKNDEVFNLFNSYIDTSDIVSIGIEGLNVFSLSANNHLMYLILHSFRHFIKYGVGLRQICDICLFIKNNNVDINRIFDSLYEVNAVGYFNAVLLTGEKYFGLDLSGLKINGKYFDPGLDIDDFADDLLADTVYGNIKSESRHSGQLNTEIFGRGLHGKKKNFFSVIFPSVKRIKHRYVILNDYPFLLPFVWIYRICKFVFSKNRLDDVMKINESRIDLMKKYGIIKHTVY